MSEAEAFLAAGCWTWTMSYVLCWVMGESFVIAAEVASCGYVRIQHHKTPSAGFGCRRVALMKCPRQEIDRLPNHRLIDHSLDLDTRSVRTPPTANPSQEVRRVHQTIGHTSTAPPAHARPIFACGHLSACDTDALLTRLTLSSPISNPASIHREPGGIELRAEAGQAPR